MIKCFTFEDFKSFKKTELNIETLTTLIGSNSSGKSNAIEGIAILAMVSTGIELSTVLDGSKNADTVIRGGSSGCSRFRTNAFKLGCLIDWSEDNDLFYEIKIGVNGHVAIDEEGLYLVESDKLGPKKNKIFKTKKASRDQAELKVEYKNAGKDMLCVRSSAVLPQIIGKMSRDTEEDREIVKMMERVAGHLKNINILNPVPSELRNYVRISDTDLKMTCYNLSAVLNKMCKSSDRKAALLEMVRSLSENDVDDIKFIETKIGDVIFALKEKSGSLTNLVDARQLSDGTLRCIAVLTAVLMGEPGSMILIEEIDNGIHPARVHKLIDQLVLIGKERNMDIVITTHNATLLNLYKKDELIGVSVVYREKEKGTSQIKPLVDIDDFPGMLAGGGLGNAMVDERLLHALKDEKQKKDYSWLGV